MVDLPFDMVDLPHKNEEYFQYIKSRFKKVPNKMEDFNSIFFHTKRPFFKYINNNKEADKFLKYYKYLQKLVFDIEYIFPQKELPLLKTGQKNAKIELTRKQAALLFLLSFFNCIKLNDKNNCNLFFISNVLFCKSYHQFEFARCFLNYLTQIGRWISKKEESNLNEKITYIRDSIQMYNYQDKELCDLKIKDKGSLFDAKTSYFVDFANKYIGGGVLCNGCVQEEILFAVDPEAVVSLFFMQVMDNNDAIGIYNVIQYSNYQGF